MRELHFYKWPLKTHKMVWWQRISCVGVFPIEAGSWGGRTCQKPLVECKISHQDFWSNARRKMQTLPFKSLGQKLIWHLKEIIQGSIQMDNSRDSKDIYE